MISTTHFELRRRAVEEDAAAKSKEYVRRHWKYHESPPAPDSTAWEPESCREPGFENFLERIQSYSLCISGMAFQDAWNIDLDRLQRCCIHVIDTANRLIPFCAYYLTDSSGRRLIDYY